MYEIIAFSSILGVYSALYEYMSCQTRGLAFLIYYLTLFIEDKTCNAVAIRFRKFRLFYFPRHYDSDNLLFFNAARKQEIIKITEQLIEAVNNGDFEAYA